MEHGVLLADGVFRFEEVPFVPGWQYAVMLNYEGATYFSEPAAVTDGQAELALDIPIFEATTSIQELRANDGVLRWLHLVLPGSAVAESSKLPPSVNPVKAVRSMIQLVS